MGNDAKSRVLEHLSRKLGIPTFDATAFDVIALIDRAGYLVRFGSPFTANAVCEIANDDREFSAARNTPEEAFWSAALLWVLEKPDDVEHVSDLLALHRERREDPE
jgi:hypothetical protein